MISALLRNAISKRATMGERYVKKMNEKRHSILEYLERKKYRVLPFGNSFYALGTKRDEAGELQQFKIFSLVKRKMFRRKPIVLVDFLHPNKELTKRTVMESILESTIFTCQCLWSFPQ